VKVVRISDTLPTSRTASDGERYFRFKNRQFVAAKFLFNLRDILRQHDVENRLLFGITARQYARAVFAAHSACLTGTSVWRDVVEHIEQITILGVDHFSNRRQCFTTKAALSQTGDQRCTSIRLAPNAKRVSLTVSHLD
jgi:hypothetical protein